MSGSFAFTPGGDMVITKDARTVFTTAGRLVSLLPAANDFGSIASPQTVSVAFPDFSKDYLYNWRWTSTNNGGGNYAIANKGDVYTTVPPQEYSNTTTLVAVPSGCNITAAKVRINRTTSPTKTWFGNTILVKPKTNVWIPFTGSVLLEEMLGMCRAFSLYIDGSNNLVLHKQQSIGAAPGGTGTYGDTSAGGAGTKNGGEWVYGSAVGLTVYTDGTMTGFTSTSTTDFPSGSGIIGIPSDRRRGGANAISTADPTNYASTYTIDLAIKFGRAS